MKIHVRIPGGEAHTIDAMCITDALRIFYCRGGYVERVTLEAKWSGWKGWAVYSVRTEVVVTRLGT